MRSFKRFKPLLSLLTAMTLLLSLWPGITVASSTLHLVGNRSVANTNYMVGDQVILQYCIDPEGSYEPRDPVDISFVFDVSGSMGWPMSSTSTKKRIAVAKESSNLLVDKFASTDLNDQIGVIKFSGSARVIQNLTTDFTKVREKINGLNTGGGTNIHHGLMVGYDQIEDSTRSPFIVLLTDGAATYYYDKENNQYKHHRQRAKDAALDEAKDIGEKGVPIYPIAMAVDGSDVDIDLLRSMAEETGGIFFEATDEESLDQVFTELSEVLDASITNVKIKQPLPAGFELVEGQNHVSLNQGMLQVVKNSIPHEDPNYNCQMSVQLRYTGSEGTVELEPAKVSYDVTQESRQFVIDDPIRLNFSEKTLSMNGTATPADNPTTTETANWPIDHRLRVEYDLDAIGNLASVYSRGSLRDISITHILPAGVTAPSAAGQGWTVSEVEIEGKVRKKMQIELSDIQYHSDAFASEPETKDLVLSFEQLAIGDTVRLGGSKSDDLTLSYTDNHGNTQTVQLDNKLPSLKLSQKSLTMQGKAYLAPALTSAQRAAWSSKDILQLRYDLEPLGNLFQNRGTAILENVQLVHVLPVGVEEVSQNPDYKGDTVLGGIERPELRYRLGTVTYTNGQFSPAQIEKTAQLSFSSFESDQTVTLNEPGVIYVSFTDNLGINRTVRLDNQLGNLNIIVPVDGIAPVIDLSAIRQNTDDPEISISVEDDSRLVKLTYKVYKNGSTTAIASTTVINNDGNNTKSWKKNIQLSDLIPQADQRPGWYRIDVYAEDEYENHKTETLYFTANPGPEITLEAIKSGTDTTYVPGTASNKPVQITVTAQSILQDSRWKTTFTQYEYQVTDSASPASNGWKPLKSNKLVISKTGISYVHVRITEKVTHPDDDRTYTVTNDQVIQVRIDYNQNRY
ncbi:vWA domain-containing protein [Marinicrinis sediminis]|uniref:VWA domain-containing protein n=1 Tax=Marinicrinis sediminis TaxID=1652465 RepID=A0ABW5RC80_9BACL